MADILNQLISKPGVYWGRGEGPESGRFVGRIEVQPALNGVLLHYEAFGDSGLQHVEHALLGRIATGLSLRTVIDAHPEVMTFGEIESGVFRLEGPVDMRILVAVPESRTLVYSWWWAHPGEEVREQSRLIARV